MIILNGQLMNSADVNIGYMDRGYNFGDGVYEVFRIYGGRLFEVDGHMRRLLRSASEIDLMLPYSRVVILEMLNRLLEASPVKDGTLYIQITRGEAPRTFQFPAATVKPVLLAYTKEVPRPLDLMKMGISAVTLPDIRWLRCDIKSLNLLGAVLSKQKATAQGYGESILHREGIVTEGSACNVMMIEDGVLYTHPANHLILNGITRIIVLNIADRIGIPIKEVPFTVGRLKEAAEVFITGTTVEITPVHSIDGSLIGDGTAGPLTARLQAEFELLIR